MPYIDFDEVDQLDEAENEQDPYSEITDRPPLEEIQGGTQEASQQAQMPSVKDVIAQRRGISLTPSQEPDPLLQNFEAQQNELNQFRDQKMQMDRASNIGQIAHQAARGPLPPTENSSLFNHMNQQSSDLLRSKEHDLDRRQRIISAIEARLGKSENRNMVRNQITSNKDQTREDKLNKNNLYRFDKLNKMLTAEVQGSSSVFGRAALNKQSIQNAEALIKGELNPDDLDPRQVYETSKVLDRVLSQGGATVSGTESLTPKTAVQWLAKAQEYITNQRKGAKAGSFINSISKTFQREKLQANKQINDTQKKLRSSYSDLEAADPNKWKEIMTEHGLTDFENTSDTSELDSSAVSILGPDGRVRVIPKDKLDAALKAGGKLVQ